MQHLLPETMPSPPSWQIFSEHLPELRTAETVWDRIENTPAIDILNNITGLTLPKAGFMLGTFAGMLGRASAPLSLDSIKTMLAMLNNKVLEEHTKAAVELKETQKRTKGRSQIVPEILGFRTTCQFGDFQTIKLRFCRVW